ncbi:MAG: AAA family ATPase, partial [Nannocystaceae bacterium]
MNVILLAHLNQKAFKDPERDAYDRNVGKLHPVVWGLIREWAKEVLFATFETFTKEGDDGRTRGVSSGKRVLRTQWSASYDAKNRHNLPPTIPFEIGKGWEAFTAACAASNT